MTVLLEVGRQLRELRLGSRLSPEEAARSVGISRAVLYRYEQGNIVKLATLDALARLYGSTCNALLGLGSEYATSGLPLFERLAQLESQADQMLIVFGPVAYVLTSDPYDDALAAAIAGEDNGDHGFENERIMRLLKRRKKVFHERKPGTINIIPVGEIAHYLEVGISTEPQLPAAERSARRRAARREMERLAHLIDQPPMGLQIALSPLPLPSVGFQIMRFGNRKLLVTNPFRLGPPVNLRYGVAMISEDEKAVDMYERLAGKLWEGAYRGARASEELARLIRSHGI